MPDRQAAVIRAVGLELRGGDDARLDQHAVQRDGIMTNREQEAVAAFPGGILGLVAQRVEVGHRQHVGHAERLGDVALPLHLAHP
jgi:hypothetical protein